MATTLARMYLLLKAFIIVSRIYALRFATLALVESMGAGGAYMRDLTFYLVNTLPSSRPTPRC